MKHIEVSLGGRHSIVVDELKTRWWLVEKALHALCHLTGCRVCMWRPIHWLEYIAINSRRSIWVPVDDEHLKHFAEWADIEVSDGFWDEDEEPTSGIARTGSVCGAVDIEERTEDAGATAWLCTEGAFHAGDHQVVREGRVVKSWPAEAGDSR